MTTAVVKPGSAGRMRATVMDLKAVLLGLSVEQATATTAAPGTNSTPGMTAAPGSAAGGQRPVAARVKRQKEGVFQLHLNFQVSVWKARAPAFTTETVKTDLSVRTSVNTECAAQNTKVLSIFASR